jgi:hypothetical protein
MKIASMAITAAVIAILPIQLEYSLGMALHSCGCATTAPAFSNLAFRFRVAVAAGRLFDYRQM